MDERLNFEPIEQIDESLGVVRELLREPGTEIREQNPEGVPEFDNEPKPARLLAERFGVSDRAIQNWYPIIRSAYCWLPETEFKMGMGKNTRYPPLAIKAMMELKAARVNGQTADDWVASIHRVNKAAIENWKASQLPKPQPRPVQTITSPQIIGGLMNLPSLLPVDSSIVPQGQPLPTDDNPAKDLTIRSNALSEGLVEIENLKNFLKGASAVADSYIENLEKTTEEEERQAKEIEDLAFELEVKADYIKRAEVRKAVVNKEASKTRSTAESKVANFADFFVKRSNRNASS